MFESLTDAKYISLDLETYDPDIKSKGCGARRDGRILGVAIGTNTGIREYYPITHPNSNNFPLEKITRYLNEELANPTQYVIGANILYDLEYLKVAGVDVKCKLLDVQIAEPLIDENQPTYSLDSLAQKYLGEGKKIDWIAERCKELGYKGDPRGHLWKFTADEVAPYAKGDVDMPLRIFEFQKQILKDEGLLDVFSIECRLLPLLLQMKMTGCAIDLPAAWQLKNELVYKRNKIQKRLTNLGIDPSTSHAGRKSVAEYFLKLGVSLPTTEKTLRPKVDKEFLKSCNHPVASDILEFKTLDKLITTFIDSQLLSSHVNGRIHAQFNSLRDSEGGTVTGRFSSSKPNLQNIPARGSALAQRVRALFIPEKGHLYGSIDYSQIEYRILCHIAMGDGSDEIREALNENPHLDIHEWCAYASGLCHDRLTPEEKKQARSHAKNINFGIIYGQGVAKTAASLGIPFEEAKIFLATFNEKMPFAKYTANTAMSRAENRGWVKTILGRRRRFNLFEPAKYGEAREALPKEEAIAKWGIIKRAFTYKALNAIVQGSSADLLKLAMVKAYEEGIFKILVPLTTVHDELNVSVPQTPEGMEAFKQLVNIMENCYNFKVPIIAEAGLGKNWSEAKS